MVFGRITYANPNMIYVEGEDFYPMDYTKIYDDLSKNNFILWKNYLPGSGNPFSENTKRELMSKYVDTDEFAKPYRPSGGRSSYKKSKKSSKRIRSMKRYISKSRKYSRRK